MNMVLDNINLSVITNHHFLALLLARAAAKL